MDGRDLYLLAIIGFLLLLLLAIGVRSSTFDDAVKNCIQANADWRVDMADAYCNSVIREGRRP
jgi:hypothetical protein